MIKTTWRSALSGAAILLWTASSGMAQEATQEVENEGPVWLATCNNQADPETLMCSMTQRLTVASSGQQLLAVTVQPGGEAPSILLSLPHGLSFSSGVGFATDSGTEERFEFTTADATGTYARVPLTADRLSTLRAANTLRINVVGVAGRDVNFEVSLAGFSKTYDLLK